jgi:esterase/lipase superfamily enzyme
MGVDPLLRALEALIDRSTASKPTFGELVLVAPDLHREHLEHMAGRIRPLVTGTTLYVSSNDRALAASRAVHGEDRAGTIGAAGPLIVPGIDTIDVTALDTDYFTLGHSTYGERRTMLSDIAELLTRGTRPPQVRMPSAKVVQTTNGMYWRYEP